VVETIRLSASGRPGGRIRSGECSFERGIPLAAPDEDSHRVDALNIAGSFFPRRCAEEFRSRARWSVVAEEYPVFYPRDGRIGERLESAADMIVATASGCGPRVFLTVECKKADPRFVEWVFIKKYAHSSQLHRFRNLALSWDGVIGERPLRVLREGNPADPLCDFGCELMTESTGKDRPKPPTTQRIQDAARQAVLALRSFVDELWQRNADTREPAMKASTVLQWLAQSHRLDFVPVVITTAKLLVCDFDARSVDLRSARMASGLVKFDERPWVVYDYPLTGGLSFGADDVLPYNIQANPLEIMTKIHVLFLQSSNLPTLAADGLDPLPKLLVWR